MTKIIHMAILLSGASALALPAMAQTRSSADSEASGNDIVVTATRQSQSLRDVPMTVNVATGEQLEKLNILGMKDVQQLAPGLELTNNSGRNDTTTLRGVSFDPDQNTGPAVRVYYNEAPVNAQTVFTAIYDIQQIEVLRGPQGLLRGLSAPAGSITITTRRPSFTQTEGYAQGTATTRAGYNLQGGVSVPLSDKFALRVAGLIDGNRQNQVRNINRNDEYSRSRTESFRATLGMKPTDNFTAYLTYQYLHVNDRQNQQVAGPGNHPAYNLICFVVSAAACGGNPLTPDTSETSGPSIDASDYRSVSDGLFSRTNRGHFINLNTDWNLGPATLSFLGNYQYTMLKTYRDTDAGNAVPNYVGRSYIESPYKVWTAELRLSSNNDEGLGWNVGAFYTKQTGVTIVRENSDNFFFPVSVAAAKSILGDVPYLPINTNVYVPIYDVTTSFNANLRYKSGPFKIEGGLRYSILKTDQTTQLYVDSPGNSFASVPGFSQGPTELIPANLQKFTNRPLTGGININYELSPTLNVYAAYGRAFRSGSTQVSPPVGISADLLRTKNEKTDSYEIGLKGAVDRRVNFSLSAYYQKIDNFLTRFNNIFRVVPSPPASSPTGFSSFNYNGNAEVKGGEAEITARVTDDWDLGLNLSYAHARYSNARLPCNDFSGSGKPNEKGNPTVTGTGNVSYCISNGRISEIPDFGLSANTEIRVPLGTVTPFIRGLVNYRPGFHSERVNYDYKARTQLNLYAGVRGSEAGWELSLFVKNLLNQKRITNISLGDFVQATSANIPYNSGYRLINTMLPREAGITLNYRF